MDDDVEVEDFEVSDYDLLFGMRGGLGLGTKRKKRTKEHAIYGIWSQADSDDEDSYGGLGRKSKKDYSKPLSFVSGGIVQKGGEKEGKEKTQGEDDDDDDGGDSSDSEQTETRSAGTNSGTSSPAPSTRGFGGKKLFKGGTLSSVQTSTMSSQHFSKTLQKTAGKNFGQWEKHTKGFGMKMLQKMGYQPGKGLGKEGQGRIQPVEAFKREGRGALGRYGAERSKQEMMIRDEEEEERKKFQEELHQWKKTEQKDGQKPKYVYKTVEEVKAGGSSKKPSISLVHSKIKVVDMTGPETKILTGYGSLANQHAKPGEIPPTTSVEETEAVFSMPELQYNLGLLVDMAESEIIQTDRQLKHERDLVVNLKYEEEKLSSVLEQEDRQIKRLTEVMEIIDSCRQQSLSASGEQLTLDKCEEMFKVLQEKFYEEYKIYELSTLATPLVFPLMREHLRHWQPLVDRQYGLDVMQKWKDLLESDRPSSFTLSATATGDSASMEVYEQLVWDVWMPVIRATVSSWNPRDCDPMIELIEQWLPVLPTWITDNIRDQLILPRLQMEVDAWNPLTDHVPIHAWIHPWLPLMSNRMEPLYAPIRYKLATALTNWHPADPSAKMMLEPWQKVWSKGSMDAFVLRSIYPKLSQCLAEFVINPHQQHLEPFTWVLSWKDVIPHQHFVSLMDKHFFPKWHQVLRTWLSNHPNYDEVTKWYMGWKSMFSDDLWSNPSIKAQFNRALDTMNQAVASPGGVLQPGAKENIAYLTSTERRKEAEAAAVAAAAEKQTRAEAGRNVAIQNAPTNFKDLIQKLAEDNNILFMPIPNRRHEGKALYSMGKATIYIDRGVVFVQSQGSWKPVSLQNLLAMAA